MSIGTRVFLGFVLVQVASAALILGWYFHSLRSELADATRRNAQEAVLQSITATENYFSEAQGVAEAAQVLLTDKVLGRERPEQLERYFAEQLRLRPQLAGLYVGYPDGGFVYVMQSDEGSVGGTRTKLISNGDQNRTVDLTWRDQDYAVVKTQRDPNDTYDPRTRAWYEAAATLLKSVWTEPYIFFTSRKPGITLAVPIMADDGTVAAVLGVDIELGEISAFLARSSLGLGGSAYIATTEGKVIANSSTDLVVPASASGNDNLRFRTVAELGGVAGTAVDQLAAQAAEQAGSDMAVVREEEADGRDYFIAVGQMSDINRPWKVVVIAPKTSQMEVGGTSNLLFIGIVLLVSALACIAGYLLSRSFGRPLTTLRRNALLARNGNIEMMQPVNTGYREIDETANALYDMAKQRRQDGT